jgi:DNA topoisomerase IA
MNPAWQKLELFKPPHASADHAGRRFCQNQEAALPDIKRLLLDKETQEIICATDSGREGELIFRLIYEMAGCTKPVMRLWSNSIDRRGDSGRLARP